MKKIRPALSITVLVSLFLTACGGPATPSADQIATQVAQALAQTQAAYTPTPADTPTPANTATSVPTSTPKATNTPKPTNTPRPTATPDSGTMKNPYAFNQVAQLTLTHSGGKTSDFSVQVLEFLRGPEANKIVKRANMFNDDPPTGAAWGAAKLKVTLVTGAPLQLAAHEVGFISAGQIFAGFSGSMVCCTEDIGYPELDANLAIGGATVDGWVFYPVIEAEEKPLLVLGLDTYSPDLEKGIFFALIP